MSLLPQVSQAGLEQAVQQDNYSLAKSILKQLDLDNTTLYPYVIEYRAYNIFQNMIADNISPRPKDFKGAVYFRRFDMANQMINSFGNLGPKINKILFTLENLDDVDDLELFNNLIKVGYKPTTRDLINQIHKRNDAISRAIIGLRPQLIHDEGVLLEAVTAKDFELADYILANGGFFNLGEWAQSDVTFDKSTLDWIIRHQLAMDYDDLLTRAIDYENPELFKYILTFHQPGQDVIDIVNNTPDEFHEILNRVKRVRSRSPSPTRRVK